MLKSLENNMRTCVEVLYELGKITPRRRMLLLDGVRRHDRAAYIDITNLLTLCEQNDKEEF